MIISWTVSLDVLVTLNVTTPKGATAGVAVMPMVALDMSALGMP